MTDMDNKNANMKKNQFVIEPNAPANPANAEKKDGNAAPKPAGGQRIDIVIEVSKEEDFKSFYAIGAIGVNNIYDFRIKFYNDEPEIGRPDGVRKIQRKIGSEIVLSPTAAFELARWLNQNVQDYEKKFGPIIKNAAPGSFGNADDDEDKHNKLLEGYA
ncbi:MAG: DUF3467 domain-containing protein [Methanimicrococcus sp.]|nr:DUF3467 domain-containing protein [Methanimicrococcus sp.]